jgi:hypothetical protein
MISMRKFLEHGVRLLFVRSRLEIDTVDVPCLDLEYLSCRSPTRQNVHANSTDSSRRWIEQILTTSNAIADEQPKSVNDLLDRHQDTSHFQQAARSVRCAD